MQKLYMWLYKWLELRIQSECDHKLVAKDYLYCETCNFRHPRWIPYGDEKKGK